jgi:hypothetical protein
MFVHGISGVLNHHHSLSYPVPDKIGFAKKDSKLIRLISDSNHRPHGPETCNLTVRLLRCDHIY